MDERRSVARRLHQSCQCRTACSRQEKEERGDVAQYLLWLKFLLGLGLLEVVFHLSCGFMHELSSYQVIGDVLLLGS